MIYCSHSLFDRFASTICKYCEKLSGKNWKRNICWCLHCRFHVPSPADEVVCSIQETHRLVSGFVNFCESNCKLFWWVRRNPYKIILWRNAEHLYVKVVYKSSSFIAQKIKCDSGIYLRCMYFGMFKLWTICDWITSYRYIFFYSNKEPTLSTLNIFI